MLLSCLLNSLSTYKILTPTYQIIQEMYKNELKTDHIALRSFKSCNGIDKITKILTEHNNYIVGGEFEIPRKHLNTRWFYTTNPIYRNITPRIFVSEIDENKLSNRSQSIIKSYMNNNENINGYDMISLKGKKLWGLVDYYDYSLLAEESEYAAFTLIHSSQINHIALHIPIEKNIIDFINTLEKNSFVINTIGGKVKTSNDGMLHQASTMSDYVIESFKNDKIVNIPAFYVEFVQRDKYKNGSLREGFEANNATHIFESTNKF